MRALTRRTQWLTVVHTVIAAIVCAVLLQSSADALESKPFGVEKFSLQTTRMKQVPPGPQEFEEAEPYIYTQAGGHPWSVTSTVEFTNEPVGSGFTPTRDPKDIVVDLPPGLLGNPMAVPRCPLTVALGTGRCPADTQIGMARIRWQEIFEEIGPIVNLTPEEGQSAEFGLENKQRTTVVLTAHLVHTAQGYGFTVVSKGIPVVQPVEVETIFWGVPADPSHDSQRGLFCQSGACDGGGEKSGLAAVPFLTMPTDCSAGAEIANIRADSWQEPGSVGVNGQYSEQWKSKQATMPGVTGCNLLAFDPSIEAQPDTLLADEPVGLGVTLKVPLNEKPESTATPQIQDSVLTFPEGVSVSPGIVDGIQACDEFGPNGINITGSESEEVGVDGELQLAVGHCPDASIVGTAEAVTPLLPEPVKGHVYLARPGCGGTLPPCTEQDALDGNLYRLYLELGGTGELAKTGVHFKVAFDTEANPATGQLTTRVVGTPQAPFSELKVRLNGGPRAPLDTPAACGPAVTSTDFTPWSAPGTTPAPESLFMPGTPDATPSSFFEVNGCSNPPVLHPGFLAGTVSPQAARYSAFTLNLSRADREQYVKSIQVRTPPGLLGMLSSVPLCGEAAAEAGTCPESAKIGTTTVASGAGSHPFEISGNVYLTGPYKGAPFGLSVVTHAVAGPFDLGLVVVRARIDVNRATSTLTVTTDETGPHAIPQIVFGVPLRLQRVTVDIDRPSFMFNPTNCSGQKIEAIVSGADGATADVWSPFAASDCKSLEFKPKFAVSTNAHTSRANGAALDVKLTYPAGSFGQEANIAHVKVSLPKQLPSRLTTLQQACPAQLFETDPAACPKASVVGIVRASTPLLPVQLTGPVYFVSHGGEAFPSLVVVLEGDGVRVDLTGTTFISKAGITSSTFKTVPDVPVNSFELYLPQGKYSALAANGNLCKSRAKLTMPTEFVAQNGAVIKQSTKIAVTGCGGKQAKTAGDTAQKSDRHGAKTQRRNENRSGRTSK